MTLPALYRPATSANLSDLWLTLDGWSAPATDDNAVEWWASTVDGWLGTPELRLAGTDRPQDHGGFDAPSLFGTRIITVAGSAIAPNVNAAMLASDIVSSLCWDPSRLHLLQVREPSGQVRRSWVRLNVATKVALYGTALDWQLQLKAPDPRRYDDTEQTMVLSPPTGAEGGITLPLTAPFSISTTGMSTSSGVATNAGTVATRPTVTIAGPLADPQIANLTAGRSLSLLITLAADDTLEVDLDKRTVMLNGTASRSNTLTATAAWWELAPGGNDLVFAAGGGDGTATIRWRSAWL